MKTADGYGLPGRVVGGRPYRVLSGLFSLLAIVVLFKPQTSNAADDGLIEDLEISSTSSAAEVVVLFRTPAQYLRHSPRVRGRTVLVQVDPLAIAPDPAGGWFGRQVRRARRNNPAGLIDVAYERDSTGAHTLEFRFKKSVRFVVREHNGFRGVVLTVSADKATPVPAVQWHAVEIATNPSNAPTLALPFEIRVPHYVYEKPEGDQKRVRIGVFENDTEGALHLMRRLRATFSDARVVRLDAREAARAADWRVSIGATGEGTAALAGGELHPAPPPSAGGAEIDVRLAEARRALTAGDPETAIQQLELVLSQPEHAFTPEATELLGMARERNQQLAHAKRIYNDYLEQYPGTDGAERVSQRLAAMLSAAKPGRAQLPTGRKNGRVRYDVFGSAATFYRQDIRNVEPVGRIKTDSSVNSDLLAGVRVRLPRVDLRSEFNASYQMDFLPGGRDRYRFRSAFVEVDDRLSPWSGHFGRRSANSGGVIERYDGVRLRYELANESAIQAVAGFPVNVFSSSSFRSQKFFGGLSYEHRALENAINTEFYGIAQQAYGHIDRVAVGSELRYIKDGKSISTLLDFDLFFMRLNTVFLTGFWQLNDETHLNFLLDHRYAPILTTSNAIIGLGAENLGDLDDRFTEAELKDLAKDRTARSTFTNLGLTHRISDRFQVSSDFSLSIYGSTDESDLDPDQRDPFNPFALEQVAGTDAVGPDYALYTQLIGNDLWRAGDIGIAGLRLQRGDPTDFVSLILSERLPVVPGLRVNPLVTVDYRRSENDLRSFVVRPTLRFDYRYRNLTFDVRGDYLWEKNYGARQPSDETGYTLTFGVRYTF